MKNVFIINAHEVYPLETFACHDVLKNPDVENDFIRFEAHLDKLFPSVN